MVTVMEIGSEISFRRTTFHFCVLFLEVVHTMASRGMSWLVIAVVAILPGTFFIT